MITVIIATRNGAPTLPATLDSLARQADPGRPWRLLAVDNGSSDATPDILASYAGRLPLTALREERPGQNAARNRALAALPELDGLVVFTDDDVIADPRWLAELSAAAARHPGFGLFGGRIEPDWPCQPPEWVLAAIPAPTAFAATDPGLQESEIPAWQVFSPNMAVRAALLRPGHRFSDRMGPDGSDTYAMGSETEFLIRMAKLGHRALHCPSALVRHVVRPHQFAPAWLRGRARRYGRGQFRLRRLASTTPPSRNDGLKLLRRLMHLAGARAAAQGAGRAARLRCDWDLHVAAGELLEWRAQRARFGGLNDSPLPLREGAGGGGHSVSGIGSRAPHSHP